MLYFNVLISLVLTYPLVALSHKVYREEVSSSTQDVRPKTTPDIISSEGYPVEVHHVVTEDGYILELHRIPHGIKGPTESKRPVTLLQHCLLCSSSDWVINKPDKALGFILADAGYDVWLGNARGNTYSRRHVSLKTSDKKFWNFSWDEMAYYDIPASIDYILNATNSTNLNYIGFSMGTVVFYAMMSEKPEYNNKVRVMIALGPVAYLENMSGPLAMLTRYADIVKSFVDFFGINEVLSGGVLMDLLTSMLCDPVITHVAPLCDNVLLQIIGLDTGFMNKRLLPTILAQTPAGTSVRTMVHFMQAKNSGRFQKYSYGLTGNKEVYKTKYPPAYRLENTKVPVALFWAANDWYANPKDVSKLSQLLPNVILNKEVPDKTFSHVDFLWSDNAVNLVYADILRILEEKQQFSEAISEVVDSKTKIMTLEI